MLRNDALHFQTDFSADELTARRRRVTGAMRDGVAVLAAAAEVPGFDVVRQTNDFYYLTGVETPHAYLTLNGNTGRSVLYLPPRDAKHEKSDGPQLCDEDGAFVSARTGIDEVRPVGRLAADVSGLGGDVWVMRAPAEGARQCQDSLRHRARAIADDPLDNRPSRETHLLTRLAQLSPAAEFRDVSPVVHRLRLTKSPAEAGLMRVAGKISAIAAVEAMKATHPGVTEFQLGAVAEYVYQANGARGVGYRPIVAAGDNIPMMHYWRNDAACRSGDLVLFDCAPDYQYYTSDIGRMWPAGGTYAPPHRELYGFVLAFHDVLLNVVRPGRTKDQLRAEAAERIMPTLQTWPWSKPLYRQAALDMVSSPRPLSHAVGMAVHDSGDWTRRPVEPGMVFAVDPELFVPDENLYLRVEDTVLVTDAGCENLTGDCPSATDAVEALVGRGGMLRAFPPVHTRSGCR